jgi:hypothetical protein
VFLLNSGNESEIVRFLTTLLKYFIYKTKFKDDCHSILTIPHFKNYLKQKITNRKYILHLHKRNVPLQTILANILGILKNMTQQ